MRESTDPEQIKKVCDSLSLPRLGKPEEVADLVHFYLQIYHLLLQAKLYP